MSKRPGLAFLLAACAGCAPQPWNVPVTNPSHPEQPPHTSSWLTPNFLNIDRGATIPPGAMPPPNGTYVYQWNQCMATAAAAENFDVYLYEWCPGGHELSPHGHAHLIEIARNLPKAPFPVVVQPCGDEALDQVRRQLVVHFLLEHGCAEADARVILAFPAGEGLYGAEAVRLYREFQSEQRGSAVGGSAGTGNFGGGSTGGASGFGGGGGFVGGGF